MHKIQAAVLRRKGGPLEIEPLELDGPRNDEVLVRIVASGICRTDIDICDDSVGLAASMAARLAGANPIISVDINPMRLELALALGTTHSSPPPTPPSTPGTSNLSSITSHRPILVGPIWRITPASLSLFT